MGQTNFKNLIREYRAFIKGFFFAAFVATIVFIPVNGATRTVYPEDAESVLRLGPLKPTHNLHSGSPITGFLAIGNDIAFTLVAESISGLVRRESKDLSEKEKTLSQKYTYRFTNKVSVPIGTHARNNNCALTMNLHTGLSSLPVACRGLLDNQLAEFKFNEIVAPGIYEISITSTGNEQNAVAPYFSEDPNGNKYFLPKVESRKLSVFDALRAWSRVDLLTFCVFMSVFTGIGLLFWLGTASPASWIALLLLSLVASLLITPFFSGHDETAHLKMFRSAVVGNPDIDRQFNIEANTALASSDFYRLHGTRRFTSLDECPHSVVFTGNCGETNRPIALYKVYSNIASNFVSTTALNALELLKLGRIFNLLWTVLLVASVFLFFGKTVANSTIFVFLFTGTIFSQVPSITNDIPNFMYGLFLTACIAKLATSGPTLRSWVGAIVAVLWFGIATQIDVSAGAAIPPLICVVVLALTGVFDVFRPTRERGLEIHLSQSVGARNLAIIAAGSFTSILAIYFLSNLVSFNRSLFDELVFSRIDQSLQILKINSATATEIQHLVTSHVKGYFGSFVWGHSHYSGYVYLSLTLFFIGLAVIGGYSQHWTSVFRDGPRLYVFGTLVVIQFAIPIALGAEHFAESVQYAESFTKLRLTAPGIASLMALPCIGVVFLQNSPRYRTFIYQLAVLWTLQLVLFYQVKFYWIERI